MTTNDDHIDAITPPYQLDEVTSFDLTDRFIAYEEVIDSMTIDISALLLALISNARRRVSILQLLKEVRSSRQRIIDEEQAAQRQSRATLVQAKEEINLQSAWTNETRKLLHRAEQEGLEITSRYKRMNSILDEEHLSAMTASISLDVDSEKLLDSTSIDLGDRCGQETSRQERTESYRTQLNYLNEAILHSEQRMKIFLHLVSSSSTAAVTRVELTRLQASSVELTSRLATSSVERLEMDNRLRMAEVRRERTEQKRDEIVLDMILCWKRSHPMRRTQ